MVLDVVELDEVPVDPVAEPVVPLDVPVAEPVVPLDDAVVEPVEAVPSWRT